jgi:hypothetical protein
MFLLYHSEGCNICEMVLHECYVNDLHTTTCSSMLGHHNKWAQKIVKATKGCPNYIKESNQHKIDSKVQLVNQAKSNEHKA